MVSLYSAVEGLVVFSMHHRRCVPHVATDALDPVQILFVLDLKWIVKQQYEFLSMMP